ncbi:hypothetical protein AB0B89_23790 [Sphaerisporangium sp. NPDC049002]|uniref:hypothetical protein n=1 Tax=Sphaerisporangium sp. NPDC049002 TaxID=3155392 RepID=UPI003408C4E3
MALTNSEADAVRVLTHWLLGVHDPVVSIPADGQACDALVLLADSAVKKNDGGLTGAQVRELWQTVETHGLTGGVS